MLFYDWYLTYCVFFLLGLYIIIQHILQLMIYNINNTAHTIVHVHTHRATTLGTLC